ncbi:S8 family peptidase [Streptomyces qinglanensis]|uniref:Subtilase family protein n=1 Tax=Streptomyces qinglanensis TaxID=943816 RepID=A0A1H9RXI2_9ACTN|nr:S8 family peptidase [Streptomyces qinglanensis]SER77344.1 Subtilase family protein [Streptomyces qinglanensis]
MAHHGARHTKRRISVALGAAVAVAGGATLLTLPADAAPPEGTVLGAGARGAVEGDYIVLLKRDAAARTRTAAATEARDLAGEYGGKVEHTYHAALDGWSAKGLSARDARRLAADDRVAKVVQSRVITGQETQTEPPSWGQDRVDQPGPELDEKYTYPDSAGEGVTAYVVDSGVRVSHEDFGGRAVDGYDAVDDDGTAQDGANHGTHVSGTLAGTEYGIAKKAKIVAVRILGDDNKGTTADAVAGIDWMIEDHEDDGGPAVANMSIGGFQDYALDEAVERAVDANITCVVAAGNDGGDASAASPARVPDAITVAASDQQDRRTEFSNYGKSVDLFAPGIDVVSASNKNDTAKMAGWGTSMATPHVAGAAALYLSRHPDATPAQVTEALLDGTTDGALSGIGEGTPNKLLRVVR